MKAVKAVKVFGPSYGAEYVLDDFFVVQIQFRQIPVFIPSLIVKAVIAGSVALKVDSLEPIYVARILHVVAHVSKGPKAAAHIKKESVKDNAQARLMQSAANFGKILVAAQAAVKRVKVARVVAVGVALQGKVEPYGINAKFF